MSTKTVHAMKVRRRPDRPEGAGVITTYAELIRKAEQFAAGKYNLLVVAGGPGLSKSTVFRNALEGQVGQAFCFVEANASPFGAYCKLFKHRNQPVVFDDADAIHQQSGGKRFLKQVGQTQQWKHLSWESKATQGKKAPAPSEYQTSSKVAIITNQWEVKDGDVHTEAVEDRGLCFVFSPSALEVHQYVATWFWDQQIHDHVGRHLPYLKRPTCRLYAKLAEVKAAGDDWREYLLQFLFGEEDTEACVIRLMADPTLTTNEQRVKAFVESGWGSRATFYRYRADLEGRYGLTEVQQFPVQGRPPADQPDPMACPDNGADDDPADGDE